ncbi:DUF1127 domain-containing protein [Mesorhizobium sp. M0142]|uniref:hypothetical protein n=1 Tax=unclassified Mesorhizobium TaxID=325217 RepID=UPI0004123042|nr:hypothetical protein [Mesorhizobium sp. LSHC420B00]
MSAKRVEPIVDVLTGMAGRILASSSRRRTERLIARFSTRRLEDLGFAHDWDGSIYRQSDRR